MIGVDAPHLSGESVVRDLTAILFAAAEAPPNESDLAPWTVRYHRTMVAAVPPHDAAELLHPRRGAAGACQPPASEPRRLRPHEIGSSMRCFGALPKDMPCGESVAAAG
jgi:hypothetical protein